MCVRNCCKKGKRCYIMRENLFTFGGCYRMLWSIASLVLVGLGWTLTGAIMGDAPKKKIDPGVIQFLGAVCS